MELQLHYFVVRRQKRCLLLGNGTIHTTATILGRILQRLATCTKANRQVVLIILLQ
jgi:hypothetical protein